jgi:hypothetical protein
MVLRGATWIAFGIALITDFGYWLIIRVQENQPPDLFTVPFVAGYIALMGALLGISVTGRERVVRLRPALRAGAAAVGFEVSARIIVCPKTGSASGSGPGLVTGGYHYECVDGRLHMHSGSWSGGG